MKILVAVAIVFWAIVRLLLGVAKALLGLHGEPARILVLGVLGVAIVGSIIHPEIGGPDASPATTSIAIVPSGSVTPDSWADALLADVARPVTPENHRAIVAWERAEGGHWANSAAYNPLNTTQQEAGSRPINSVGVQAYTSWAQGMQATVTTLGNGYYGAILAALSRGDCAACVAEAVGSSPWGTGTFPT